MRGSYQPSGLVVLAALSVVDLLGPLLTHGAR
jgi:hypothetical protein